MGGGGRVEEGKVRVNSIRGIEYINVGKNKYSLDQHNYSCGFHHLTKALATE